jgi:hypothetical protein
MNRADKMLSKNDTIQLKTNLPEEQKSSPEIDIFRWWWCVHSEDII